MVSLMCRYHTSTVFALVIGVAYNLLLAPAPAAGHRQFIGFGATKHSQNTTPAGGKNQINFVNILKGYTSLVECNGGLLGESLQHSVNFFCFFVHSGGCGRTQPRRPKNNHLSAFIIPATTLLGP